MSQTENARPTGQTEINTAATERHIDRSSRWLTLGANIGVVLGLIVLVVEIRQNAAMTRLSAEGEMNRLMSNVEMHLGVAD